MDAGILPIDESLAFLVYRMHAQAVVALRRTLQAAGYSVTPEQWGVLARLREQDGITQSQLCEKTYKDRHNMTRILNLLEKGSYVKRLPDATDKRAYRVFLTETGQSVLEELTPIVRNHQKRIFETLSSKDLLTMRRMLTRILNNLEERLPGPGKRGAAPDAEKRSRRGAYEG